MKLISLILISQVALGSLASTGWSASQLENPTTTVSPEAVLLENVIVLEGQNLTPQQRTDRAKQYLSTYLSTPGVLSDPALEQTRMKDAMVGLGIYTPAQAAQFVEDSNASMQKVLANADQSSEQVQSQLSQEIIRLASLHPMGAQFSLCMNGDLGGFLFLTSIFAVIGGTSVAVSADHPTPGIIVASLGGAFLVYTTILTIITNFSDACD